MEVTKKLDLKFLEEALKGQTLLKGSLLSFKGVGIDSRNSLEGQIFFALKGPRFDGHDFLEEALEKGAKAFVVSDEKKAQDFLGKLKKKEASLFLVKDSKKSLIDLSLSWRKHLKIKVVAITGSNGKTTTRSFTQTLASSLKPFGSFRSYNNSIGVPLSLLSVNKEKAFLIQEIGTSGRGEISFLTKICDPVLCVVTLIAPAHLESFGSLKEIAKEKSEIYRQSEKADFVFNLDDPYTLEMKKEFSKKKKFFTYSSYKDKRPDVFLQWDGDKIKGEIGGVSLTSQVPFQGRFHLQNLMCASTLALGMGVPPEEIWKKVKSCFLPRGREQLILSHGKSFLFDAWNANPLSMKAFLKNFKKTTTLNKKALLLGDMNELGEKSGDYHEELASRLKDLPLSFLIFIGKNADLFRNSLKEASFELFGFPDYTEEVRELLKDKLEDGDLLGIKGSRSLKLERVISDLTGKRVLD